MYAKLKPQFTHTDTTFPESEMRKSSGREESSKQQVGESIGYITFVDI